MTFKGTVWFPVTLTYLTLTPFCGVPLRCVAIADFFVYPVYFLFCCKESGIFFSSLCYYFVWFHGQGGEVHIYFVEEKSCRSMFGMVWKWFSAPRWWEPFFNYSFDDWERGLCKCFKIAKHCKNNVRNRLGRCGKLTSCSKGELCVYFVEKECCRSMFGMVWKWFGAASWWEPFFIYSPWWLEI